MNHLEPVQAALPRAAPLSAGSTGETPALRSLAPPGLWIGVALNQRQSDGQDKAAVALVERHFNSISPENQLKWDAVHPEPDHYDFAPADRYLEFGASHGMFVVGHVLLWHQQTPAWVFAGRDGAKLDRDTARRLLRGHIQAVAGRYRGRIGGWDVVNEAFEDDGSWRKTPWLEAIGEEYVADAFEYAHEADPQAELYYNDFNLWMPAKRDAAIALGKRLRSRGLRVDGIGEQGHWGLDDPSVAEVEAMVEANHAAGFKTLITELDVDVLPRDPDMWGADLAKRSQIRATTNAYPDGLPELMQQKLAARYAGILGALTRRPGAVGRVTIWGVTDADTWLDDFPIPGRVNHPLLWDRAGRKKPALDAVVEVLKRAGRRSARS
jgi:endo-1,4-beta-xylanase